MQGPRLPACMWKRESCKYFMIAACRSEPSQHLSLLPKTIRSVAYDKFLDAFLYTKPP